MKSPAPFICCDLGLPHSFNNYLLTICYVLFWELGIFQRTQEPCPYEAYNTEVSYISLKVSYKVKGAVRQEKVKRDKRTKSDNNVYGGGGLEF